MFTLVVFFFHSDVRFLFFHNCLISIVFFFCSSVGLNAVPMDPDKTGIYPVSSGNGTVQHSWNLDKNYTVCTSVFGYKDAKVVCLNWGYLP